MTENQEAQSGREPANGRQRKRARMAKLAWSQSSFDLLASGYSPEQIAEVRKVSVRTIRREIDSAIARRQLDAPERYVHLQVARLTKALRFADAALERGDLKAVRALVTVVAAMDRYHGCANRRRPPRLPHPLELHARRCASQLFHASPPRGPAGGATSQWRFNGATPRTILRAARSRLSKDGRTVVLLPLWIILRGLLEKAPQDEVEGSYASRAVTSDSFRRLSD